MLPTETLSKKLNWQFKTHTFFSWHRRYIFSGGFKQAFKRVPSSQLINPAALSREASGLISNKKTSDEIFYV